MNARRALLRGIAALFALPVLLIAVLLGDTACALAYAALAPLPALPRTLDAPRERALLVLGDSLGQGYGATPGHGWVDIFGRRIAERDANAIVVNASVGGSRVGDVIPHIARIPKTHASVVFLVAGGNDLMSATDPLRFARNEHRLLETIAHRYPGARIIVTNVPDISWRAFHLRADGPPEPLPAPLRVGLGLFTDVDNTIVECTARRFGARILDLHGLTLHGNRRAPGVARIGVRDFAADYIGPDGLHPNDRGYALLADFAWPTIAEALHVSQ